MYVVKITRKPLQFPHWVDQWFDRKREADEYVKAIRKVGGDAKVEKTRNPSGTDLEDLFRL